VHTQGTADTILHSRDRLSGVDLGRHQMSLQNLPLPLPACACHAPLVLSEQAVYTPAPMQQQADVLPRDRGRVQGSALPPRGSHGWRGRGVHSPAATRDPLGCIQHNFGLLIQSPGVCISASLQSVGCSLSRCPGSGPQ
jgi:hypothetical protein